jgi:hypothetical protein
MIVLKKIRWDCVDWINLAHGGISSRLLCVRCWTSFCPKDGGSAPPKYRVNLCGAA